MEALRALIRDGILAHHDRVMDEKGDLESCWFARNGTRIRREQDLRAERRSSRFENVVSILRDLGLLVIDEERDVSVTPQGRRIARRATEMLA